ncbi:hypothetical protein KIPB_009275 [Kipferlia bialata]|uniref:Secreted protein n=1 Tax=Kipferlia bialata TaxID=797122 RepID=A0A9K3D216_9EUKA|nr:hypothetical protein KIPB_009275 [Kipferlia bialata]|eukprot:g9275.t1
MYCPGLWFSVRWLSLLPSVTWSLYNSVLGYSHHWKREGYTPMVHGGCATRSLSVIGTCWPQSDVSKPFDTAHTVLSWVD